MNLKKIILKLLFVFSFLFCVILTKEKVYGYNLKFKAFYSVDNSIKDLKNSNDNINGYVLIRTYGNTFGSHGTIGEWSYADGNSNSFERIEANKAETGYTIPFYGSYQSHALMLHKSELSDYSSSYREGSHLFGYDEGTPLIYGITNDANQALNGVNMRSAYVSYKRDFDDVERYYVDLDGDKFKIYRNTYLWADVNNVGGDNQTVTVTDWLISESWLRDKIENKPNIFFTEMDGEKTVYFSLYTVTSGPNASKSDPWNSEDGKDAGISHLGYKYWNMKTCFQALEVVDDYNLWGNNRGIIWDNRSLAKKGQSIANLYDNILEIPVERSEPQEVYVRHIDEDGNLINIENPSEVLIQSGKESILRNQKNGETPNGYQEYYSFNLGDRLKVSRSLTMAVNGKVYKYKAYKTTTAVGELGDAERLDNSSRVYRNNEPLGSSIPSAIEVGGSSTQKTTTIVTFIYSEVDVPGYPNPTPEPEPDPDPTPDPGPSGDVHTEFSNDPDDKTCIQKYTPTDKDITPYLVANKMYLKDLKYKLVQDGNTVKYKMEKYNIQQLIGGKMTNDSSSETGYIYGDEPYALLKKDDENRDLVLNNNDMPQTALELVHGFSSRLPTQNQLDSFITNQPKTSYSDFDNDLNRRRIPKEKYNGLRTPKLYANYKAVDVLTGNDTSRRFRIYSSKK